MYRGCDEYSGVKDEEADRERALPRGARHPADYVIRTNVTPRSSVINYKELDIARMDSILLRVGLTPRVIGMPRS